MSVFDGFLKTPEHVWAHVCRRQNLRSVLGRQLGQSTQPVEVAESRGLSLSPIFPEGGGLCSTVWICFPKLPVLHSQRPSLTRGKVGQRLLDRLAGQPSYQ